MLGHGSLLCNPWLLFVLRELRQLMPDLIARPMRGLYFQRLPHRGGLVMLKVGHVLRNGNYWEY
jgi:hypothetical protein